MNIEKRKNYEFDMTLNGIDTLSCYVSGMVEYGNIGNCKRNITRCNYKIDKDETYLTINPNKTRDGEKLITKYSEFVQKMNCILGEINKTFDDLDFARVDFCFNSTNISSYGSYQKLHRLIISCLAKAYAYKKCYVSCDLWSDERLSLAIKKDDSEIENYNKFLQSDGKDEACNRLELRSKRMSGTTIEYQFVEKWFERLDKSKDMFREVQDEANYHLEKLYKDDLAKPKKERNYSNLTAFLLRYSECIYSRKQMINLLGRFDEVKNPVKRADKLKENHEIEYFTQTDINYIIKTLKRKVEKYFNS